MRFPIGTLPLTRLLVIVNEQKHCKKKTPRNSPIMAISKDKRPKPIAFEREATHRIAKITNGLAYEFTR